MPVIESRTAQNRLIVAAVAVALILVAGVAGFSLAPDGPGEDSGAALSVPVATERARIETLREMTSGAIRRGYRDGRANGLVQGRASGKRAGRTDAEIMIARQEVDSAEAEAAAAQGELSAISTAPPAP